MKFRDVMQLPLKTFWLYSKNIDRILSEVDLRQLQLVASATSSEAYGSMQDRLRKQMGLVVKVKDEGKATQEDQLDRAGLADLKAMARGF
ncbi:hypothetical protein [Methylobacterium oryzae]|uniref:hypothetical protein n=1 Tax=Methylobacterium oryzae TaxID=334852 RepID=UPI001F45BB38|nr:hypothetical protein [Methylobacterium oryzae]UIN38286.1 hypothetical protein LXM90_31115 [Methylobacterium oryzae]